MLCLLHNKFLHIIKKKYEDKGKLIAQQRAVNDKKYK